jgi:predicted membrane protein
MKILAGSQRVQAMIDFLLNHAGFLWSVNELNAETGSYAYAVFVLFVVWAVCK